MTGRHILIDGYNVIRANPELSRVERRSLEAARRALLNIVAAAPRLRGDDVTVVFDGAGTRSFATAERLGSIRAVYSPPGKSADDVIKSTAASLADPSRAVVVTNDMDIRLFCERLGCLVTSPENMLGQLQPSIRPARHSDDEEGDAPPRVLGTKKKGNPRRAPKAERHRHDVRF
ncbi:MAG TPA: NYN domain-containing protein [Chloroflexota bacterium]|nr:NYN domain-containing protein [Chloroflexota bacterium]